MAINFPDFPNPGDFHTVDQTTWVWDGDIWAIVPVSYPPNDLYPPQAGQAGKFLGTDGTTGSWTAIPPGGMALISSSTFTGASEVIVNDVFSSTFKDYQIRISDLYSGYIGKILFRLRVGGVDEASSYYSRTNSHLGTNTNTNTIFQTSGIILGNRYFYASPGYTMDNGMSVVTITNPFELVQTSWVGSSYVLQRNYSGASDMGLIGGHHDTPTSYTGFTMFHESGYPMSGRVSVYGLET